MTQPPVTVVVETVTPQTSVAGGALADRLAAPFAALARQSYPQHLIERVVVVGGEVSPGECQKIAGLYPETVLVRAAPGHYVDAKNQGALAGSGEIVTFLDGDCTPQDDWLERLIDRFEPGVTGVAGCVRYTPTTMLARVMSVPDFAYILEETNGQASGFNLGNVAFQRSAILQNPLDARIKRNGGCYNLFHQLRAQGARILYEPGAQVVHAPDFQGLGFLTKHWTRGYDGLKVYSLDQHGVFRGTRWYRRLGPLALVALHARRIAADWIRIARHRRQMGVSLATVPAFAALAVMLRSVELAGAVAASLDNRAEPAS